MIKTTRSRLEIRQEPDAPSSLAGALIVAFGAMEFLIATGTVIGAAWLGRESNLGVGVLRAALGALFFAAGWFFLRQRSRVVLDLDHRMVLLYIGVGGRRFDGNESHDLADFSSVVLTRSDDRRLLGGAPLRSEVVCLRRPDGSDLEVYWASDPREAADTARRVADFAALPYLGRGSR
ncbi:MAG: hypothetical protein SF051_16040 [Elusimicrobiota bacterium]|nr:hypothetical protein [Elusimicrobiota bacterium]